MILDAIVTFAIAIFLLVGAAFTLVGSYGLMKLPDAMTRLHAPTKVGTMGVGALLLASMTHAFVTQNGSFHELLVMGFLFVTAPISANFMSKVNIHLNNCDTTPDAPDDQQWCTLVQETHTDGAPADKSDTVQS